MRVWKRWIPNGHAEVERPLTPIRGDANGNIMMRVYATPGSESAAEIIDGIVGTVRRYITTPATVDTDEEMDEGAIGLQIIPVATEMQSDIAYRSQEVRRTASTLTGQNKVTDGDLAEMGYLAAHRGGWSALIEYLEWMYSHDNTELLSHEQLYAAIERLDGDKDREMMVEERRADDDVPGTGLNEETARTVHERGYYVPPVKAGTHEWLRHVPRDTNAREACITVNGQTLRTGDEKILAGTIRSMRTMYRDDEGSDAYRKRVEELIRND